MKEQITLESKEVKTIIAKFLGIKEENVIPNRYSFGVTGITSEEIEQKLKGSNC